MYFSDIKIKINSMNLSNQTVILLKKKKTVIRQKFRNKYKPNYEKICSELKILNVMIFNSIKNDFSEQTEKRIRNIFVDNNMFKHIKNVTDYKKKCTNA